LVIGAIAAHLLEVYDDDLEWDVDRFRVRGVPELSRTMTELACAGYNNFRRAWSRGSKRSAIMTRRT
jgi:carbon-monoxide dehydrogenase large subunit